MGAREKIGKTAKSHAWGKSRQNLKIFARDDGCKANFGPAAKLKIYRKNRLTAIDFPPPSRNGQKSIVVSRFPAPWCRDGQIDQIWPNLANHQKWPFALPRQAKWPPTEPAKMTKMLDWGQPGHQKWLFLIGWPKWPIWLKLTKMADWGQPSRQNDHLANSQKWRQNDVILLGGLMAAQRRPGPTWRAQTGAPGPGWPALAQSRRQATQKCQHFDTLEAILAGPSATKARFSAPALGPENFPREFSLDYNYCNHFKLQNVV